MPAVSITLNDTRSPSRTSRREATSSSTALTTCSDASAPFFFKKKRDGGRWKKMRGSSGNRNPKQQKSHGPAEVGKAVNRFSRLICVRGASTTVLITLTKIEPTVGVAAKLLWSVGGCNRRKVNGV